jgi:hypothetical protein
MVTTVILTMVADETPAVAATAVVMRNVLSNELRAFARRGSSNQIISRPTARAVTTTERDSGGRSKGLALRLAHAKGSNA